MNNRTILKGLFLAAFFDALVMAVAMMAPSYSQLALTKWDGLLQLYLGAGSLGSLGLCLLAGNRNDLVKILLPKIQFGYLYLGLSLSFLAVSAANVYDAELAHMIATGFVALFAYVISWNYFPKGGKRSVAVAVETLGLLTFLYTFVFDKDIIARGEFAISFTTIGIIWVIINEQIRK